MNRAATHDARRVVVIGEFNSGKTTLVNELVGADVLTPSIMANTTHPTVVAFAPRRSLTAETGDGRRVPIGRDPTDAAGDVRWLHVGMPVERLRSMSVVDTPGLGLAGEEDDRRALQSCRNADIVIWCTPAMQAWKASEERTWLTLPHRMRARGILAVTFADEIAEMDACRVLARLRSVAGSCFREIALAGACVDLVVSETASVLDRRHDRAALAPAIPMAVAGTLP
jgi:GTPase Era involved in 16S rRNA processing